MPPSSMLPNGSGNRSEKKNPKLGQKAREKLKARKAMERVRAFEEYTQEMEDLCEEMNGKSSPPPLYSSPSLPDDRNFTGFVKDILLDILYGTKVSNELFKRYDLFKPSNQWSNQ
jgi:hypothetical protein